MLSKILFFVESLKPKVTIDMLEILIAKTDGGKKSHIKGFYPIYIYRVLNELSKASFIMNLFNST